MAFFLDLAEEIAGDAMDAVGDQKRASKSIAIVMGKPIALRISVCLLMLTLVLSLIPVVWGELGMWYLLTISLTDILIIFFGIRLLRSQTLKEGRWSMRGIYLGASFGLLAFLFGRLLA